MEDSVYHDPLKRDFIVFKMGIFFNKKRITDTDVVSDIMSSHKSVIVWS